MYISVFYEVNTSHIHIAFKGDVILKQTIKLNKDRRQNEAITEGITKSESSVCGLFHNSAR